MGLLAWLDVTCRADLTTVPLLPFGAQKDKSQLTIAELREAKQKKEAMLKASLQGVAAAVEELLASGASTA